MSTEASSTPAAKTRASKPQGWRTILKGTHTTHLMRLSNPAIMLTCKRTYPQTDSRLYFALLVAPPSLRDESGTPSEQCQAARQMIENSVNKCSDKIDEEIARLTKLLDSNGIALGEGSGFDEMNFEVHTPLSKKFLQCFDRADYFMRLLDSLWIESVLDDDQRQAAEKKIRKILNAVPSTVETAFVGLLRAMQKAKADAQGDDAQAGEPNASRVEAVDVSNSEAVGQLAEVA